MWRSGELNSWKDCMCASRCTSGKGRGWSRGSGSGMNRHSLVIAATWPRRPHSYRPYRSSPAPPLTPDYCAVTILLCLSRHYDSLRCCVKEKMQPRYPQCRRIGADISIHKFPPNFHLLPRPLGATSLLFPQRKTCSTSKRSKSL